MAYLDEKSRGMLTVAFPALERGSLLICSLLKQSSLDKTWGKKISEFEFD